MQVLRNELASASDLLVEVKKMTSESADKLEYVDKLEFHIRLIESDAQALIEYLTARLDQAGGDNPQNRRFLLSVQWRRRRSESRGHKPQELDRYLAIAEQNLLEERPSDQDYRHWFDLYRNSTRFDITEAIARCY